MTNKRFKVIEDDDFDIEYVKDSKNFSKSMNIYKCCDLLNELNDEIVQLKKCNRQLAKRCVAIPSICTFDCQFAKYETVGHGDMRWCCLLIRTGDPTCHFDKICPFLEGLEPIEDLSECVRMAKE